MYEAFDSNDQPADSLQPLTVLLCFVDGDPRYANTLFAGHQATCTPTGV